MGSAGWDVCCHCQWHSSQSHRPCHHRHCGREKSWHLFLGSEASRYSMKLTVFGLFVFDVFITGIFRPNCGAADGDGSTCRQDAGFPWPRAGQKVSLCTRLVLTHYIGISCLLFMIIWAIYSASKIIYRKNKTTLFSNIHKFAVQASWKWKRQNKGWRCTLNTSSFWYYTNVFWAPFSWREERSSVVWLSCWQRRKMRSLVLTKETWSWQQYQVWKPNENSWHTAAWIQLNLT